jgi:hypothetical protein
MVTEIRIYYEGDRLLREGFDVFFSTLRDRAREKRCSFHLIAARGTPDRDFQAAIKTHPNAWNVLLKDSEGPDSGALSVSLCRQNEWSQSHAGSIFWMVEMMESWFHADKDALEKFYGPGFKKNSLKANPNVEQISKKDLKDGLSAATKSTRKGDYYDHKTSHGPKLLASISPELVREAAHHCQKLFQAVLAELT